MLDRKLYIYIWIDMSDELDNLVFTNNMRLCSEHFDEGCLEKDGNLVKLNLPDLNITKMHCFFENGWQSKRSHF